MDTLQGRTKACMIFYNIAGITMEAGHLVCSKDRCSFPLPQTVGEQ